ncbi:hypothetical protein D3C73_278130 [compost metagenome]
MKKVLYFEGAGMDYEVNEHSNAGNYRIRTAFTNNDGIQYYLELSRGARREETKKGKLVVVSEWALHVDFLFTFEDKRKHEEAELYNSDLYKKYRNNELTYAEYEDKKVVVPSYEQSYEHHLKSCLTDYTKEGITAWINNNLNCSFDTIEVLDMFYGYYVHGDNRTYNLIDNHIVNHELATKRREAYNAADMEYRQLTNEKYSVIGLMSMDDSSITVRCHASEQRIGDNPRIKTIQLT